MGRSLRCLQVPPPSGRARPCLSQPAPPPTPPPALSNLFVWSCLCLLSPQLGVPCYLSRSSGAQTSGNSFSPLLETSIIFEPPPTQDPSLWASQALGEAEPASGTAWAEHGLWAPGRVGGSKHHEWERSEQGARAQPERGWRVLL